MELELTPVIVAVITVLGAALGSAATLATTLSPTARRIKRLEGLVELREGVKDPAAARAVDYATEQVALQVAESARLNRDQNYPGFVRSTYMLLGTIAVALIVWLSQPGDGLDGRISTAILVGAALLSATLTVIGDRMRKTILDGVQTALDKRRNHQGRQAASAEGAPEGDVPPA